MIKIPLAVAVLVSLGGLADPAMAQGNRGEAFGSEISSQCAHRRIMAPNLRDGCIPGLGYGQLRYGQGRYGQSQLGYGQSQLGYRQDQPGYRPDQTGYAQAQPDYGQGGAHQQLDQRDEEQPKVQHEQPKISAPPKVATASAPKAKKTSTPPRIDAQKEQELYQEFLQWRNRRLFFESTP